ncbi:hypothetical protein [Rossellomorea aquimaris]|uniref:hypothetical protein n=1 Tax=Rossellomorea aquimaris TaxID=189382 RepID=UPI0007D07D58|nr:hypothetical protein [Rossellomorea aquimaris]
MEIIFVGLTGLGLFLLFNWLMGYKQGYIQIDFDERYYKEKEYIDAIQNELESQGKEVNYQGDHKFLIDGKPFLFIERNVSMGGVPLQRTILKPVKK